MSLELYLPVGWWSLHGTSRYKDKSWQTREIEENCTEIIPLCASTIQPSYGYVLPTNEVDLSTLPSVIPLNAQLFWLALLAIDQIVNRFYLGVLPIEIKILHYSVGNKWVAVDFVN